MPVSISVGNSKMGPLKSVSLPSIVTCRHDCECNKKCYAHKLERLRPSVRNAYANNYDILIHNPDQYWEEVETAIKTSRFFRFHVSGDIVSFDYFVRMTEIAVNNPWCEMLCFTKKYSIVNRWISKYGALPSNLHIVFSAWRGLEMDNPYSLPEAHVKYRDGTTTARMDAVACIGNCTACALAGDGCWTLKNGEQVVFKEH